MTTPTPIEVREAQYLEIARKLGCDCEHVTFVVLAEKIDGETIVHTRHKAGCAMYNTTTRLPEPSKPADACPSPP